MWAKRIHGQLAKCTEAQALRKAWPEIGQEPSAEEMEGKHYVEREINPVSKSSEPEKKSIGKPLYTQERFNDEANEWANAMQKGILTPEKIIKRISIENEVPDFILKQIHDLTQEQTA